MHDVDQGLKLKGHPSSMGFLLITAHKRSLGLGNVFTGVCLSTGGGFPACIIAHMTSMGRGFCLQGGGLPTWGLHTRGLRPVGVLPMGGLPTEGGWADIPPEL